MKKVLFLLSIVVLLFGSAFSQSTWKMINQEMSKDFNPKLISSTIDETLIEFKIGGFYLSDVNAPVQNSKIVSVNRSGRMLLKGKPDLVQLTSSIIIPDNAMMQVVVEKSEYTDYQNIEIAPSKGNFSRSISPENVPFEYDAVYQQNAFYPGKLAEISDPFILRDFRGATVITYPFQYNPITKVLRVYHNIVVKVEVNPNSTKTINPYNRNKAIDSFVDDFKQIYKDRFLNFSADKYVAPVERGRILVISDPAFIEEMMPYVRWKNQIGFPTEIVSVSTIGNNSTSIKNYVTNYYNTNGLAFLLLVGDAPQVATANLGNAPGGLGVMYSDNFYGDILGNDDYYEVIVGRFSATTTNHVATQVRRTLEYEKAMFNETAWLPVGLGLAANEGAGQGHDGGESDYQHMDIIRTRLLTFTYNEVHREYDQNVPGLANTNSAQISAKINNGASILNYINHGSETSWSVGNYSNSHVNALTNVGKLPFIWAVACLNGKFTHSSDCMGEAWLKATHNTTGAPTGALAAYMATISQPWLPPMDAQDEFNRVLIETFSNKIRRSYGAISISGTMHMLDLGPTDTYRKATATTWTIFGDPSVMVRTDVPSVINASHLNIIPNGETMLQVNANKEGAFVTLTNNYEIVASGVVNSGVANLTFNPVFTFDTLLLTITAFNCIPYECQISVMTPTLAYDIQSVKLLEPKQSYNCTSVNLNPKLVIRNLGINTVNSLNIHYKLNNDTEQIFYWSGSLPSLGLDTVVLPAFSIPAGNNSYIVRVSNPNNNTDGNFANDTAKVNFNAQSVNIFADFAVGATEFCDSPVSVQFTNLSENADSYTWDFGDGNISNVFNPTHQYQNLGLFSVSLTANAGVCGTFNKTLNNLILIGALPPSITDAQSCGPDSMTLYASSNSPVSWYSDAQGLNFIHFGDSLVTPYLTSSQTYYVGTEILNQSFGAKADSSGVGSIFTATSVHGLIFNCYQAVTLKSVYVYASTAGNRTFRLENSSGTLIQNVTVYVPAGGSRVTLNLNVPVGNNLKLMGPASPNLFRNGSNTAPDLAYPFAVGNYIDIVSSTASGFTQKYYYYFYDWEVVQNCKSALVPVTAYIATIPNANFSSSINNNTVSFTNLSGGEVFSSLWDFGDGNTSTQKNPVHTYQTNGVYDVKLFILNSCNQDSIVKQVSITTSTNDQIAGSLIQISPNPTTDFCFVKAISNINLIQVFDFNGKLVFDAIPNSNEFELNVSSFSQGVYFVKITLDDTVKTQKLIKQ